MQKCRKKSFARIFISYSSFSFYTTSRAYSNAYSFYTCDKQVLWEGAGAFFPGDNSLVSALKSHSSGVRFCVKNGFDFKVDWRSVEISFNCDFVLYIHLK